MWRIPNYSLFINIANYGETLTVKMHAEQYASLSSVATLLITVRPNIVNYGDMLTLNGHAAVWMTIVWGTLLITVRPYLLSVNLIIVYFTTKHMNLVSF